MPSSHGLSPHGLPLGLLFLGACSGDRSSDSDTLSRPECPDTAYEKSAIKADVSYLAAPELDGRVPGTEGDEAARSLVAERFACLGLAPLEAADSYQQPFTDQEGRDTANVIGYLPGGDPTLREDIVVVSAHIDHLGRGRLGANDNASGVSGLLSIAQALAEGAPPLRTVVFAAFGAEESGSEGSARFVTHPPSDLDFDDVVYNINLDMVGSYDSTGIVYALGTMRGTPGRAAVEDLSQGYPDLEVGLGEPSDLSDNGEFCLRGVPYVFFWTEDVECYHSKCDTADRLDYSNLVQIARLSGDTTLSLANSAEDLRGDVRPGEDVCGF